METNKLYVYKVDNINKIVNRFLLNFNSQFNPGQKVLIKPNWVNSRSPDTGATTNMELIEEVIKFFRKKRMRIILAEGSGYEFDTEKAFKILNVDYFKKYNVKVVNTRKCATRLVDLHGKILKKTLLPADAIDADWIINIPKIKTHVLTGMSLCLKNLFGLLPDKERRFAHTFGLNQAIIDLATYFNDKTINLLDGITAMSGEGPVFGDTFNLKILIAGTNMADIDKACCGLLGVDFKKIHHIRMARSLFSDHVEVISEYHEKLPFFQLPTASGYYKFRYWGVFAFDWLQSRFSKRSFIPNIVTRFGVQLFIDNKKCNLCGKCIKICPMGAITQAKDKSIKIDFEKCRYVRCFKCFDLCEPEAIKIKGFSQPRKFKSKASLINKNTLSF